MRQTHLYDAELSATDQRAALRSGSVPVAVYGLGKMGLPLSAVFAEVTGNVTGVDVDEDVVAAVQSGTAPVDGEPGLDEAVATHVADGGLAATTESVQAASDACLHVVIVPTLLDESGTPDLSALDAVVETIGRGLRAGDTVLVESTLPPGTCRDRIHPMLVAESGLDGDEFGLAFCPERTSSGRALRDIRGAYPKIVGGYDEESRRVAQLVYDELTDNEVVPVADCTTAEAVKLFEGVYRDVNIALANELTTLVEDVGVDVRDAISAANTQPYCDIHSPGPGVGGHCIPYYPYFLFDRVVRSLPLLRQARAVNEGMPAETAAQVAEVLDATGHRPSESTVALLGVTYRAGVDETRASPAAPIAATLAESGTSVYAVDPVCSDFSAFDATPLDVDALPDSDPDALVVLTAHDAFETLDWDAFEDVVVIDTRDALDPDAIPHPVYTLGRGYDKTVRGAERE
jgi:UDP-N-acetyl-D-mannosaminuronic acid dehydrogenase